MRFLRQVVLPLAIVLALVAGVTYVSHYVGGPPAPASRARSTDDVVLHFVSTRASWDEDDPEYLGEFEQGETGQYDFWFRNPAPQPVEVTLEGGSADEVSVGLLAMADWGRADNRHAQASWQPLGPGQSVTVPAADEEHGAAVGVVRLRWRNDAPGPRRVTAELGLRAGGRETQQRLEVPLQVVPAVQVRPDRVDVGELLEGGAGQADFLCWSVRRDAFELVEDATPPCFSVAWKPLDAAQRRQVAVESASRPQSGYLVSVRVTDRSGPAVLDLGPFEQSLRLRVKGSGEPVVLTVAGVVRGSGRILSPGAGDRLELGRFPRHGGVSKSLVLGVAGTGRDLKLVSSPPGVAVQLTPLGEARWELTARVPPERPAGSLPAESAIVLEIIGPEPRRWRIPVSGQATQ